ncbi:MAG: hypothetical protein ACAI35_06340 [Candidatus Methylacidiphilales bacterium]|nr:hypothetical protein [Candidatus Methylacidiphilales bacterium]
MSRAHHFDFMKLLTFCTCLALLFISCTFTQAQNTGVPTPAKTVIQDKGAYDRLLGDHKISLQWISWDNFGQAIVTEKDGVLSIEGEHKGGKQNPTDFLTIKGVITEVDELTFTFDGTIVTQISHIAKGEPVTRTGVYTFAITKNRPYWRMREMNNPKDGVVDYIDIYFRKPAGPASTAPKKLKKER